MKGTIELIDPRQVMIGVPTESNDFPAPADGGKTVSYQIERRERPVGDWTIAGMALKTEIMLTNQDRGKDLEYRVIPVNTTGQGEPSATIAVVL